MKNKNTQIDNLRKLLLKVSKETGCSFDKVVNDCCRNGIIPADDYTLEEIGRLFKVSRERVRQIEDRILKQLQHPNLSRKFRNYYFEENKEITDLIKTYTKEEIERSIEEKQKLADQINNRRKDAAKRYDKKYIKYSLKKEDIKFEEIEDGVYIFTKDIKEIENV